MRLKKLQVSGFKSFVDSTDIRLPSHLVGVVGPNGCGKSNVIDAVRWVMGESSAKMLRGDNMADVIFNGSSARKPVGKASVELIFDNSDGTAPGNYGQFAEISVKRTLTRDGHSNYSINSIKTRRRDVLDLFRGTGLGPRSYSIIEQGMVSRIVEARPEDLRLFVEEAAGTSKYKDRRRETENRIANTRENLERVSDIRDELGKQLRRLKRQSASARRYKVLKEEEREVNGQLQVLRLNALNQHLEAQDRLSANLENALQSALAVQRQTESELELLRKQQGEAHEKNNLVQQGFYQNSAEITQLEQKIEFQNQSRQRAKEETRRLEESLVEREQQVEAEMKRGIELREELDRIQPELELLQSQSEKSESALTESEKVLQDWLLEMENFNEQSRAPVQQIEIQKSRIEYLEKHIDRTAQNIEKLEHRIGELKNQISETKITEIREQVESRDSQYQEAERQFLQAEQSIKAESAELQNKRDSTNDIRTQLKEVVSRLNSLREIQNASLGNGDDDLESWLNQWGIDGSQKLAGKIKASDGWERAADRVLHEFLSGYCVDQVMANALSSQPNCSFSLISRESIDTPYDQNELPPLSDVVEAGNLGLSSLLHGIYTADSVEEAFSLRNKLLGREFFVTREGVLIGANWVSFASESQLETGVLVREEEISQLTQQEHDLTRLVETEEQALSRMNLDFQSRESELEKQKNDLNQLRSDLVALHNNAGRKEAQYLEGQEQLTNLANEREELNLQISNDRNEIENATALLDSAAEQSGNLDQQRTGLIQRRDLLNSQAVESRKSVGTAREKFHEKALQKQKLEAEIESARENIKRIKQEITQSGQRLTALQGEGDKPENSNDELTEKLNIALEQKLEIENRFSVSKDESASFDKRINQVNAMRATEIDAVNEARDELEQHKLSKQEILVRRDTHLESMEEQGYDNNAISVELNENATIEQWQDSLEEIEKKIGRIGPVNLVAIEEFDEESERMAYLDTQHGDLTEALEILESVIRKIDRETRARFKETFDKINAGFNEFFPKLFGGGKAELQLTSDDFLTAGIGVMARPPGKRNSHIHLLSGGEKALTAVALIFSLFKLNPAPFCMLDEVDAPLDDANVDRYCETLKTLAEYSQMVVITHNKITMEAMDLLVGVTMAEAGVSRLVSVDIDQALEIASQ